MQCSHALGLRKPFSGAALVASSSSSRHVARPARLLVTMRTKEAAVGVFGTKAGMTQIFTKEGLALPATVIALEEGNIVTQVKTTETDGYGAVQTGYQVVKESKLTKPELGHLSKSSIAPLRHLREWKVDDVSKYEVGQQLKVEDMFDVGDLVDIAGTSIGKGFQGSIKRWGMARGLMTHGSKSKRQHGSIGQCATPARVLPGLKMAGQMGNKRIKVKKLQILKIDPERRAIVVKGAVPGKPGNTLEISKAKHPRGNV